MKAHAGIGLSGLAFILSFVSGCDLSDGGADVVLDGPPDGAVVGRTVTFSWHISDQDEGETYHCYVLTDKGENPFDGHYEDTFDAGQNMELTIDLPSSGYYGSGTSFEWGVIVSTSTGDVYRSDVRRLTLSY